MLLIPLIILIFTSYMANYKCHVTGSSSSRRLAPARAPVYCKNDQSKCVQGAKQMIAWNRTCLLKLYYNTILTSSRGGRKQRECSKRSIARIQQRYGLGSWCSERHIPVKQYRCWSRAHDFRASKTFQ